MIDVARHPIPGGVAINTGAAPIVVLTPAALAKRLPGVDLPVRNGSAFAALYLSCGDLRLAAAALHAGGVMPVALPDGALALPASRTHGIIVVFK